MITTNPVATNTPLVLLSGLAADASVFTPQKIAFPQMQCPRSLNPERSETINDYAARLAETIGEGPCIIGGASFERQVNETPILHESPNEPLAVMFVAN